MSGRWIAFSWLIFWLLILVLLLRAKKRDFFVKVGLVCSFILVATAAFVLGDIGQTRYMYGSRRLRSIDLPNIGQKGSHARLTVSEDPDFSGCARGEAGCQCFQISSSRVIPGHRYILEAPEERCQ